MDLSHDDPIQQFYEGDEDQVKPIDVSTFYDYAMVFPLNSDGSQTSISKYIMSVMVERGLEIFPYNSVQNDELIVLIRCLEQKLKTFADSIKFELLADEKGLERFLSDNSPEKQIISAKIKIRPIKIEHREEVTSLKPCQYVYLRYREKVFSSIYKSYEDPMKKRMNILRDKYFQPNLSSSYSIPSSTSTQTLFKKSVRLRIIYFLLKAPATQGGCDLEISNLLFRKHLLAFYPLHDRQQDSESRGLLMRALQPSVMPWSHDLDQIKEYFGEKYTLYFVFIKHFSRWLFVPSLLGLIAQLFVWSSPGSNPSHPASIVFAASVPIWAIAMLAYWKREEHITALQWGMWDFESTEPDRPEFRGQQIVSYINGQPMLHFPPGRRRLRIALAFFIIGVICFLLIGVVASIYTINFKLQNSKASDTASFVASVLNSLQILVFNYLYQDVAKRLTDAENHRTDTQFQDSLTVKVFFFQFINSYASFFFLAYVAPYLPKPSNQLDTNNLGQCGAPNCMIPLSLNLGLIFGSRILVTNVTDVLNLTFTKWSNRKRETKGIAEDVTLTPPEKDYLLFNYDPINDNIQNFADTVVQFGFMTFFVSALPIVPLFNLLNEYLKPKILLWKGFKLYQRPIPVPAQDIGSWMGIFSLMSYIAVLTNAGIFAFTMNTLTTFEHANFSMSRTLWLFIGFQWAVFSVQFFLAFFIPQRPDEFDIQTQRIKFISEKVVDEVPDEDFDDLEQEKTKKKKKKRTKRTSAAGGGEDSGEEEGEGEDWLQCCSLLLGDDDHSSLRIESKGDLTSPFPVHSYPPPVEDPTEGVVTQQAWIKFSNTGEMPPLRTTAPTLTPTPTPTPIPTTSPPTLSEEDMVSAENEATNTNVSKEKTTLKFPFSLKQKQKQEPSTDSSELDQKKTSSPSPAPSPSTAEPSNLEIELSSTSQRKTPSRMGTQEPSPSSPSPLPSSSTDYFSSPHEPTQVETSSSTPPPPPPFQQSSISSHPQPQGTRNGKGRFF